MNPKPANDRLVVGRLRRAWGRRGELLIALHTDWPEIRFASGSTVELEWSNGESRTMTVRGFRMIGPGPLIAFEGIDDIGTAKELTSAWVIALDDALPPMEEGEVHHAQLVGLDAYTPEGGLIGRVTSVEEGVAADSVRVRLAEGGRVVSVPLNESICRQIDFESGRLIIDAPVGLLDPEDAITVPTEDTEEPAGDAEGAEA